MGNDIQIVADIIFDDDCLIYLCTSGMGVNFPKARASPYLRARPPQPRLLWRRRPEALRRASVRKGQKAGAQSTIGSKRQHQIH